MSSENSDSQPPSDLPRHVAIIMDGNGRWAKARLQPRAMGHRGGANAVRRAVERAGALGIQYLTLYSFSSENWNRPVDEIGALMDLLRSYLRDELDGLMKQNVRFKAIGDITKLPPDIAERIVDVTTTTAQNTGLTLVLALSYGGRDELVRAVSRITEQVQSGALSPADITESTIAKHLDTVDIPDPDVVVRTGAEYRLSNFLMWQSAYAEFIFLDKNWPDFAESDMDDIVAEYAKRERRYGKI